jgi:hypothetical protein
MQNKGSKTTRIERLTFIAPDEDEKRRKLGFYKELIQDITNKEVSAIFYNTERQDLTVRFDDESVVLTGAGTDARDLTKNIITYFSDYRNREIAEELSKSIQRALKDNGFSIYQI